MTHLQEIKKLTETLPELSDLSIGITNSLIAFRDQSSGNKDFVGFGHGIYRDSDLGVMRVFLKAGSTIGLHQHGSSHEWLGVIRGSLVVTMLDNDGKESKANLNVFDTIHFDPGVFHYVTANVDTWMWAITVPPAKGFVPAPFNSNISDFPFVDIL